MYNNFQVVFYHIEVYGLVIESLCEMASVLLLIKRFSYHAKPRIGMLFITTPHTCMYRRCAQMWICFNGLFYFHKSYVWWNANIWLWKGISIFPHGQNILLYGKCSYQNCSHCWRYHILSSACFLQNLLSQFWVRKHHITLFLTNVCCLFVNTNHL